MMKLKAIGSEQASSLTSLKLWDNIIKKRKDNMRSTSDIKLAVQNVLAKYGYIMPKDLYLAIEDLHDEIESDRE